MKQSTRDILVSAAWIVAIAAIIFVPRCSMAKWKPQYAAMPDEIQSWFKQQHNGQGQWCCDESDGHPYYGDYSINADGSITLEKDGSARTIPAYMVLKGPNPTGHSVWWYIETGGQHRDYCFAPGTLG